MENQLAVYYILAFEVLIVAQLRNGQLVCAPRPHQTSKSHFVSLPCNADLILGLNGHIWVREHINQTRQLGEEELDGESVYSNQNLRRPQFSLPPPLPLRHRPLLYSLHLLTGLYLRIKHAVMV